MSKEALIQEYGEKFYGHLERFLQAYPERWALVPALLENQASKSRVYQAISENTADCTHWSGKPEDGMKGT